MAKSHTERKTQTDARERFKELAQKRTEKALGAIRMIGSIASNGKVEHSHLFSFQFLFNIETIILRKYGQ